jgi:hypothetical protein
MTPESRMAQDLKIPEDLPSRLRLVCEALWGEHWIPRLSAELGISDAAVYRWLDGGGSRIDVDAKLLELIRRRRRDHEHLSRGLALYIRQQKVGS